MAHFFIIMRNPACSFSWLDFFLQSLSRFFFLGIIMASGVWSLFSQSLRICWFERKTRKTILVYFPFLKTNGVGCHSLRTGGTRTFRGHFFIVNAISCIWMLKFKKSGATRPRLEKIHVINISSVMGALRRNCGAVSGITPCAEIMRQKFWLKRTVQKYQRNTRPYPDSVHLTFDNQYS